MPSDFNSLIIIAYFILPGFIGIKVKNLFFSQEEKTEIKIILNSLIFSIWNILLFSFVFRSIPINADFVLWKLILFIMIFPTLQGIALASIIKNNLHYKILRFKWISKIFKKIGLESTLESGTVWSGIFDSPSRKWVRVILDNGTIYEGKTKLISANEEKRELLLTDVKIFDEKGKEIDALKFTSGAEGVYINIENIEALEIYK